MVWSGGGGINLRGFPYPRLPLVRHPAAVGEVEDRERSNSPLPPNLTLRAGIAGRAVAGEATAAAAVGHCARGSGSRGDCARGSGSRGVGAEMESIQGAERRRQRRRGTPDHARR